MRETKKKEGALSLIDALETNTSLVRLKLTNNLISEAGGMIMADMVESHGALQKLDIRANQVSHSSQVYINICIYITLYTLIYIYIYICIFIDVCVYVHVTMCVFIYVYVCKYLYMCVHIHYINVCVRIHMHRTANPRYSRHPSVALITGIYTYIYIYI